MANPPPLSEPTNDIAPTSAGFYRLYERRWIGIFAMFMLEVVSAASWPWFGPISNKVARDFGFTLNEVTWLGNIIACVYLPMAFIVPIIAKRHGLKRCCDIASVLLLLSGWVRYAGTVRSLSKSGSYALIIIGQALSGISQAVFRILGLKYSEQWFDSKGRTTATMIIFLAYPIGGALGQVLSPVFSDTRKSILALAIISSVVIPVHLLVPDSPPAPPPYSSPGIPSPSVFSRLRDAVGLYWPPELRMTMAERFSFGFLIFVFASIVAAINAFPILSSQWLSPYGYSDTISGLMGAVMLLSGVLVAISTLPILDRILIPKSGLTMCILCPLAAVSWLILIWIVKPHNTGALFPIFAVIGVCSIPVIPVAIKVGAEITRNPEGSAFMLWFIGNLLSIIFVLVQDAVRASPAADPPLNMKSAIHFVGEWMVVINHIVFVIRGKRGRSRCRRANADSEEQRTADTTLNEMPTSAQIKEDELSTKD